MNPSAPLLAVLVAAASSATAGDTQVAIPSDVSANTAYISGEPAVAHIAQAMYNQHLDFKANALMNGDNISLTKAEWIRVAKQMYSDAASRATGDFQRGVITGASSDFIDALTGSGPSHGPRRTLHDYDLADLKNLDQKVTSTAETGEKIYTVLSDRSLDARTRYDRYTQLANTLGWGDGDRRGKADGSSKVDGGKTAGAGSDGTSRASGAPDDDDQRIIDMTAKFSVLHVVREELLKEGLQAPPPPPQDGGSTLPPAPTIGQIVHAPPSSDPVDLGVSANDKLASGNAAGAISDLTQAINNGGGAPSLALRAGAYLDQGQYDAAVRDARAALQIDPSNKNALAALHLAEGRAGGGESEAASSAGRAFAGGGSAGGGRASYGGFVGGATLGASAPGGARSAAAAGAIKEAASALTLGDMSAALAAASRGLALNPNDPALLNLRATIYARSGDYARAISDAKAGLRAAPRNAALLRTLGFAQVRGKDNPGAIASANELIEMDPKDALAYALRAHAEGAMGDRDAMMADLRRAAAIDPNYQKQLAQVQMPSNSDILFLFPGEALPGTRAIAAAPAVGRSGKFGAMAGAAALGGLLIAFGLLRLVMDPIKEQVSSVFTKLTRTGPTVGAVEGDTIEPASVGGFVPGLIRGQYEVVREIGAGGMGMVFEGVDKSLGWRVAIKKMRDELRVNPQERARFVIEAKTVAALKHPNIVDIFAIADDGADLFLVFEFVDGKTVHDLVQREGRLPMPEAARVVRAVADALTFAHGKGVIHRDMKPSNIMIDAQGRVKVMDFGIARMAKDALTRYSMTNTIVGTPPYMAPEQEQGQVRRESDVYALAVCAYEMLTGKLPFAGIGAGMLMNKINMAFIPPARAIAGLPDSLDAVFAKALQADPEQRYRTPQEFAAALEGALGPAARV